MPCLIVGDRKMRRFEGRGVGFGDDGDVGAGSFPGENAGDGIFENQASRRIDAEAACAEEIAFGARLA